MRCELFEGIFFIGGGRFRYTHAINCNVYAIVGEKEIALVDTGCGFGYRGLLDSLRNHGIEPSSVTLALLTHSDWDHARGAAAIVPETGCRLAVHRDGVRVLEEGPWLELGKTSPAQVTHTPVAVDRVLEDGDELDLGGRVLRVIHTPGHSRDSVCFELDEGGTRILFSGDTVQPGGKPGVTTAETDFVTYRDSVRRLVERNVDVLLPGHGIFALEGAHEQVAYLAKKLSSKWADVGAGQYPPPFDSGAWYYRNNPELLED